MTELLTESFCERCGTRYTFESAAPRRSRIGRVRVLSKGLRNFVLSDETTLSEAMADARSEEELAATALQLDAFHKAFNFCMSCRQYTCGTCWNTAEGRCLTCAPLPDQEVVDEPAARSTATAAAHAGASPIDSVEAWPELDLEAAAPASVLGTDLEPGGNGAARGHDEADAEVEAVVEATDTPAGSPDTEPTVSVEAADPLPSQPAREPAHPLDLEPGQSIEDAIAAYEARMATSIPAEPEPVSPVAEAAEAPVAEAAEAAAVAEPVVEEPIADAAAAVLPEPDVEPVPEPAPVEAGTAVPLARDDVVPQPTWPGPAAMPVTAPPPSPAPATETPATTPGPTVEPQPAPWLTVAPEVPLPDAAAPSPEPPAPPQWPAQAAWMARPASGRAGAPATLAGRPLLPADASGLWAASNLEVVQAPASAGPQPCVSCGLSLSANARFCRRCGTRQG